MLLAPALRALLDRPEPARKIGPFLLVHQLGRGGFAPVWLAREIYGDVEVRRVAIKLFALDPADHGGLAGGHKRVMEEARLLCRVEHPNIVRFYSLLSDEASAVMGLVMEYVEGASLEKHLRTRVRLPLHEAMAIGSAVATALSAIHRAGLVHRDVKPANIVEAGGVHKLIDFGIAAAERRRRRPLAHRSSLSGVLATSGSRRIIPGRLPPEAFDTNMRALSSVVRLADGSVPEAGDELLPPGTTGYIDPVCVGSASPATPSSDLYALGATLFECLTGKLPSVIAAGQAGGMKGAVLDGRAPAPPLLECVPEAPPALAALVDALLAPERERRPASAEAVAIRLERIRAERLGRAPDLPPESVGPFRGLGRFERADRDVYFGRSAEVAATMDLLRRRGLVTLVGASGTGKSSLARAGIAPLVAGGGLGGWIKRWDTIIAEPGARPRAALAAALAPLIASSETPAAASSASASASAAASAAAAAAAAKGLDALELEPEAFAAALAAGAEARGHGVLLVIDQLEELVTVADAQGATWLADVLAAIADPPSPFVRVLATARRDLLDPLLAIGRLGRVLPRSMLVVTPMRAADWADAIDQALAAYGYSFEDGRQREELLGELTGTAAAMPLVQFALAELWGQRDTKRKIIPRAGLAAQGGLSGAFERHAEATLRAALAETSLSLTTVREVMLAMTTPQGTRATRSPEELERLASAREIRVLLERLEAARILVRQEDGLTLAHDTLLTQWWRLRDWIASAREDRLLAEDVERDAARWMREKEDPWLLWKKQRLAAAEELLRIGLVQLSSLAERFIRRGRGREQRGKIFALSVALIALALAITAGARYADQAAKERIQGEENVAALAMLKRGADEQQGRQCKAARELRGRARRLLAEGRLLRTATVLEKANSLCFATAPETWPMELEVLAELGRRGGVDVLCRIIDATSDAPPESRAARIRWGAPPAPAPPTKALVSAGQAARALGDLPGARRLFDKAIEGLERAGDQRLAVEVISGSVGEIRAVAWSKSGDRITLMHGDTVSTLDVKTGAELLREALADGVTALSPDGEHVASESAEHAVQIFRVPKEASTAHLPAQKSKLIPTAHLPAQKNRLTAMGFSASGDRLVSVDEEDAVRIWSVKQTSLLGVWTFKGASSAALSPDGELFAVGTWSGAVQIVRSATGDTLHTSPPSPRLDGKKRVSALAFSPDNKIVAWGSEDGTIMLWRPAETQPLRSLLGHTLAVFALAFSPDGKRLASTASDRTVQIWDPATGNLLADRVSRIGKAGAVAFSQDGRLASGWSDRTLWIWDVAGQRVEHVVGKELAGPLALDFSPRGDQLATASDDHTVRLWGTTGDGLLRTLRAASGEVTAAAFSPDGSRLVSGARDRSVRLWATATGNRLRAFPEASDWVSAASLSANGDQALTILGKTKLRIWSAATGKGIDIAGDPSLRQLAAAWSPEGDEVIAIGEDGARRAWDAHRGALLWTRPGSTDRLTDAVISPDRAQFAAWKWNLLELRSMETGAVMSKLKGHNERIEVAAFSNDGRRLASASGGADRSVLLWDTASGALLRTMTGHTRPVTAVAVSPAGTIVAASADDGTVLLFREESESPVATLRALAYADAREDGKEVDEGGGYVMDPAGYVDFVGPNACAVLKKVVCRVGAAEPLPFEVCEDRFYVPGLLSRVLSGDASYGEAEAPHAPMWCGGASP